MTDGPSPVHGVEDLVRRLRGLAMLRQHAVNTMPAGFMAPALAKATADIGTLTAAATALEAMQAERTALQGQLQAAMNLTHEFGQELIAGQREGFLAERNAIARAEAAEASAKAMQARLDEIAKIAESAIDKIPGSVTDDYRVLCRIATLAKEPRHG